MNDTSMTLKSFTLLEAERGETSFYVGSHVNQLLGLSRGALYSKYPDLRCRPARREEKHLLNKLGIIGTANMVKVTVVSKCDVHEIVNNHYAHLRWALDQNDAPDEQARQHQSARLLKKLQRRKPHVAPTPAPPPSPVHRRRHSQDLLDDDDNSSSQSEMNIDEDDWGGPTSMDLVKTPSPQSHRSFFRSAVGGPTDEPLASSPDGATFRAAMLSQIETLADDVRTFDQEARASGSLSPNWDLEKLSRELASLKSLVES